MLGRIDNFKVTVGSTADTEYMLMMRQNTVHYVHLIDIFAPCIVSSEAWNNTSRMKNYCGDSMQLFQNHVLSVSDEAFLLLILINYTATWKAEIDVEIMTQVRAQLWLTVCCCIKYFLILVVACPQRMRSTSSDATPNVRPLVVIPVRNVYRLVACGFELFCISLLTRLSATALHSVCKVSRNQQGHNYGPCGEQTIWYWLVTGRN
jgi:hypothetical protein